MESITKPAKTLNLRLFHDLRVMQHEVQLGTALQELQGERVRRADLKKQSSNSCWLFFLLGTPQKVVFLLVSL